MFGGVFFQGKRETHPGTKGLEFVRYGKTRWGPVVGKIKVGACLCLRRDRQNMKYMKNSAGKWITGTICLAMVKCWEMPPEWAQGEKATVYTEPDFRWQGT